MRFFADAFAKQARAVPPALAVGALPFAITMGTAFDARTIASKAFHVAPSGQETITMSPSVHRRLQPLRYLHDCSDCFRLERCRVGLAPTAAFARRTPAADIS